MWIVDFKKIKKIKCKWMASITINVQQIYIFHQLKKKIYEKEKANLVDA